jgi:hypothetical protein
MFSVAKVMTQVSICTEVRASIVCAGVQPGIKDRLLLKGVIHINPSWLAVVIHVSFPGFQCFPRIESQISLECDRPTGVTFSLDQPIIEATKRTA